MRPIKLEITGLQSFSDKQLIDFDKLTSLGIFGIFGETGSGKSTILDAIIFALYDEIPRTMGSKGKNIRSSLNQDSDVLKVFFEFALGSDIFEITRSYVKKITKKNEEKFEQVNPILKMNGNVIADTITGVSSQISEHFGMDIGDFTRSVVLPQGKFSDFLRLKGNEKMAMLENIFDLEKYGTQLYDKLRSRNAILNEKLSALQNQIKGKGDIRKEYIDGLEAEFLKKNSHLNEIKNSRVEVEKLYSSERIVKELSKDLENHTKALNKLDLEKKDIECYEKDLENHSSSLKFKEKIDSLNSLKNSKEESETLLKEFTKNFNKIKDLEKLLNEEKLSKLEISDRYTKELSECMVDYSELSSIREGITRVRELNYKEIELKKLNSSLAELILSLESNSSDLEKNKNSLKTSLESKNSLKKVDYSEVESLINELTTSKFELKLAKESISKRVVLEKKLEELLSLEKEKKDSLDNILEKLLLAESENLKALSYELSKNLKEGEACPVCGSHTHPNLATSFFEDNSSDLNLLKKEKDRASEEYISLTHRIETIKAEKSELKEIDIDSLEKLCSDKNDRIIELKALNDKTISEENSLDKLISSTKSSIEHQSVAIAELLKKIEKVKEEITLLEKDILRKKEEIISLNLENNSLEFLESRRVFLENLEEKNRAIGKDKNSVENEIKDIQNRILKSVEESQGFSLNIARVEEKIKTLTNQIENDEKILNEEIKKQGVLSIDSILDSILDEERVELLRFKIETHHSEKTRLTNLKDDISLKLDGNSFDSEKWNELTEKLAELKLLEDSLNEEVISLKTTLERVKILAEEAKELLLEISLLTKKQDNIAMLQKKIEGRKFVRFLSRKKLDYVVYQASERLKQITRGRYTLCVDNSCDFVIIDAFNGDFCRETNTLSGGETFIVSLVLALALSAQLQLKGRTKLEFFFLDEGFGTLDSSLLEKVMQVLHQIKLSDNLKIGIISHVEDLKIQVPRRLEVTPAIPGEKGSTIRLI